MGRSCEGRVVIVTGAGRGIGRDYALLLAAEGAHLVVNDLGTARDGVGQDLSAAEAVVAEIEQRGGRAVANGEDVSDWKGAGQLVQHAIEHFGRLDVLINNAGILRDRMVTTMTEGEWDAVVKVHLKGTFAPLHHASVYWRNQAKALGHGVNARVINTTSASGVWGNVGQSNYGAAKAGVASLTVIAARELGRYGVTVNAICPHAVTRMTSELRERSAEQLDKGDPRWIAPVAAWLASDDSKDVTGRVIEAGGGYLAVLEGWNRGPRAEPVEDVAAVGALLKDMTSRSRRNAGMNGLELD